MAIRTKLMSVKEIQTHPDNTREGDIGAISESLKIHGQYRAIVVSEDTGNIVAGNHTYMAAVALGWKQILVHLLPDLTPDDELRLMLTDNAIAEKATYDEISLAELLTQLSHTETKLEWTGFDGDDLDGLLRRLDGYHDFPTNPEDEWKGMPGFDQPDLKSKYRVAVHFPTEQDRDNFFALIEREPVSYLWWPESDGHVGYDINKAYVAGDSS